MEISEQSVQDIKYWKSLIFKKKLICLVKKWVVDGADVGIPKAELKDSCR